MIRLGIYDEMKITLEGICELLNSADEMEIVLKTHLSEELLEGLKHDPVHILIINVHTFDSQFTGLMLQVSMSFPKTRVLIISASNDEESVMKSIKSGARGFLSRDTSRSDLIQAVLTIRNGHEFFSNSITLLLLNKYIKKIKSDEDRLDIKSLSTREVEIMKMWGSSNTNKEIADKLFISVRTVETHKNHIMQKLNLKTSVDMVKFAIRNNIIDL
ncbi:MAG: response regulator transcription factor [Bacteroidales bacterium]